MDKDIAACEGVQTLIRLDNIDFEAGSAVGNSQFGAGKGPVHFG
jgi:hypothetical protein